MEARTDQTLPTLGTLGGRDSVPSAPQIDLAGLTDAGRVRARNEDQFLIGQLGRSLAIESTSLPCPASDALTSAQGVLLVVADGIGGHGGGDVASAVALDAFATHSLLEMPWLGCGTPEGDALLAADLERFVATCQSRLQVVAERKHLPPRLGTTFTAAYLHAPRLIIAHVGDTRAYLLRDGTIRRLTRDHTLAASLEGSGVAPVGAFSHVLVNAIGGGEEAPRAELTAIELAPRDRVLLSSDGLHDVLDDARIAELLGRAPSAADAVRSLVDAVLAQGAPDNVTAVAAFMP
jgi:serine/threonine protein phosphatase PrpC